MIKHNNMTFENQAAILAYKTALTSIPKEMIEYVANTDIITVDGINEFYKKKKSFVLLPVYNINENNWI